MNGRLSTPSLGHRRRCYVRVFTHIAQGLLGFPSEEPNHNSGGCPIVVLMNISAEGRPVVVHIEQADLEVSRWLEIQSAAHLIRNTVDRSRVTGGTADRNVRAGSSNKAFNKRGYPPSISHTAEEEAGPVMISPEHCLGPTNRYDVVAGVRDDLQPRFYIPAKRPQCAV